MDRLSRSNPLKSSKSSSPRPSNRSSKPSTKSLTTSKVAEQKEKLWDRIAGTARQQLTGAEVYRTRVVETARANVNYLEKLLPEYQKRPEIVLDRIYKDATEEVLANAEDKMFIHPDADGAGREIRLLISRDPRKEVKEEK
mgnify:CR=1 FL=1